jgi:hypothetical protein
MRPEPMKIVTKKAKSPWPSTKLWNMRAFTGSTSAVCGYIVTA